MNITLPKLTRRDFVKAGGALFVTVVLPSRVPGVATLEAAETTLDPAKLKSWLEIRADGSIIARTGRTETGTSMSAMYAQIVAEELSVQPTAVTMVLGHTDETPDGGLSAGFIRGASNLRKVAAYSAQALLGLASTRLGVSVEQLTVANGVVSGGGKRVSYGELVAGHEFDLKIPVSGGLTRIEPKTAIGLADSGGITVTGNPPTKPVAQYSVIGTPIQRPGIRDIVTGKGVFGGDITLPGMLHARMVRPVSLGSTLVSAGALDKARFPTAQVVTKGNLVAVVSPNEWEAVQAARAVAAGTKWTEWAGLPGSRNVTPALRKQTWTPAGKRGDAAKADDGLARAVKTLSLTYEGPFVRHAPIGPFVALADVRADGTVTVWSQSSQPQGARAQIANTLGVPVEKVVHRWAQGPGQYGRTTFGGDGAQADAAILSQMLGKPVRVQWTLQEDLAWSSVSPAWVADLKVGLDADGNMTAFRSDWYSPHENDARMLGAVLAGMPTLKPQPFYDYGSAVATVWLYDKVPGVLEQAFLSPNLANDSAGGGLRGNIMRTPMQRQQTLAMEGLINEAAATAGVDPIEFRIRHTTNPRLIEVLKATAKEAGWQPRPSPLSSARRTGATPITGRGVGVLSRGGAFWVGIAEVEIVPSTGIVRVTRFTLGVDAGKVLNATHLTSVMQGGAVMGLSEALFEEVAFDESRVTSTDWNRYRIARMGDVPEIKTVFTSYDDRGFGGGAEAANSASATAVAGAFFDATGVQVRRTPLTPDFVKSVLQA